MLLTRVQRVEDLPGDLSELLSSFFPSRSVSVVIRRANGAQEIASYPIPPEASVSGLLADIAGQQVEVDGTIAVPFTVAGRNLGGIVVERAIDFSNEDYHILETIAASVAMVLSSNRLAKDRAQLVRLADSDGLTGLANRRTYDDFYLRTYDSATREGNALAVIMLDIDSFKLFNDRYGHIEGDRCLRAVARALATASRRAEDLVARFGGEEFVVVLPNTAIEGARALAERMRTAVESLRLVHEESRFGVVTVSIGVAAIVPQPGSSRSALVDAADASLYRAKLGGRNQVVVDGDPIVNEAAPAIRPRRGAKIYGRPRLVELLRERAEARAVLLAAPAGFGKSIAVRSFLDEQTARATALCALRAEQTTLIGLVRALSLALDPHVPGLSASLPTALSRAVASGSPATELADWIGGNLRNRDLIVILDDLHHVADDDRIAPFIVQLVHNSDRVHWILSSRSSLNLGFDVMVTKGLAHAPITEVELALTADEARLAAAEIRANIPDEEFQALYELTAGWPTAFAFAVRTATRSNDLRQSSLGTRELVYDYLAEQVLADCTPLVREFLLDTAVLPDVDVVVLAEHYPKIESILEAIRRDVGFLSVADDGSLRYHELFRDFLVNELRKAGNEQYAAVLSRNAALLEAGNRRVDALVLYTRAGDRPGVTRLLAEHGFDFADSGNADEVAAAIRVLTPTETAQNAMLGALLGFTNFVIGDFERSDEWFRHALDAATDPQERMIVAFRYSIALDHRGVGGSLSLLEPYAVNVRAVSPMRATMLGRLAMILSRSGQMDRALVVITQALTMVSVMGDPACEASVYQNAANVFVVAGQRDEAFRYATLSLEIALALNLYDRAAYACATLHDIAVDLDDNVLEAIRCLERVGDYAIRAGILRLSYWARCAEYYIAADRGGEEVAELQREIAAFSFDYFNNRPRSVDLADALRMAWSGNFSAAANRLRDLWTIDPLPLEEEPDYRAQRMAEQALYTFFAGDVDRARALGDEARRILSEVAIADRRSIKSILFCALLLHYDGRPQAAVELAEMVVPTGSSDVARSRATLALIRALDQTPIPPAAYQVLESLEYAGMSKLIVALERATGVHV